MVPGAAIVRCNASPSRVARAIYLSHAARAQRPRTSYGPSFVPEARAIRARHYIPNEGRCSGSRLFRSDCLNAKSSEGRVVYKTQPQQVPPPRSVSVQSGNSVLPGRRKFY